MTKETDRELLELAAKAVGIDFRDWPHTNVSGRWWQWHRRYENRPWNPLTDDGDAFRLSVKLGITLELHPRWVYARAVISIHSWSVIEEGWGNGGDPYAATRRAIVRAAAEIGRGPCCDRS